MAKRSTVTRFAVSSSCAFCVDNTPDSSRLLTTAINWLRLCWYDGRMRNTNAPRRSIRRDALIAVILLCIGVTAIAECEIKESMHRIEWVNGGVPQPLIEYRNDGQKMLLTLPPIGD